MPEEREREGEQSASHFIGFHMLEEDHIILFEYSKSVRLRDTITK